MSSTTLSTKPFDKENTNTNNLIGKVTKSSDLATNDHNTIKTGLQNIAINTHHNQQQCHKRRALGDVKNSISARSSLTSINQQQLNKKQTINELDNKKPTSLKPQQRPQFDEIEYTDSRHDQIDHFNDIMNQTTKLSNMLINSKPISYLPVSSIGTNFEVYNDKFHLDHVPNDKKFRKLINKQIKSSRNDEFSGFQIYNDHVNIEDDVFVPPSDW